MKAILCFIVGAQLLAGGAILALQDKPVTYKVIRARTFRMLEDKINEAAEEGCRFLQFQIYQGEMWGESAAVMECE